MIYPREEQQSPAVAAHYDELDRWYREIWGEHVHHGLWLHGGESVEEATHNLIARLAERVGISEGARVCDVGCGYGGTARELAREYGAQVTGYTISEAQWRYAVEQAADEGNLEFLHQDFLRNEIPDQSFDVAISIESSEHMPDKTAFFGEMHRILRPGGRIAVYAWLAKEAPRRWEVNRLLEPICREGRLPSMGSESDYRRLLERFGFEDVRFEDYSRAVRKTWAIIIRRILRRLPRDRAMRQFLLAGPENRIFARSILRIWLAYRTRSMRYGLFTARRPEA